MSRVTDVSAALIIAKGGLFSGQGQSTMNLTAAQVAHYQEPRSNRTTIIVLAWILGVASPLLLKNICHIQSRRLLHVINAVQSLLYLAVSIITLVYRVIDPEDCYTFRQAQSILFYCYVLAYEFALGYKAKAIMGQRIIFWKVTWANFLLILTLLFRFFTGFMNITTVQVLYGTGKHSYFCANRYDPTWITLSNISRNVIEILWAVLFVLPIYRILRVKNANSFYGNIKSSPYARIFIANCLYPLVGNLISGTIAVVIAVLDDKSTASWVTLLYGIQNFVATYSLNLILNLKVTSTAPIEPTSILYASRGDHSSYSKFNESDQGTMASETTLDGSSDTPVLSRHPTYSSRFDSVKEKYRRESVYRNDTKFKYSSCNVFHSIRPIESHPILTGPTSTLHEHVYRDYRYNRNGPSPPRHSPPLAHASSPESPVFVNRADTLVKKPSWTRESFVETPATNSPFTPSIYLTSPTPPPELDSNEPVQKSQRPQPGRLQIPSHRNSWSLSSPVMAITSPQHTQRTAFQTIVDRRRIMSPY